MRKKTMKLNLSKETVTILARTSLADVKGAWGTIETECCASMNITRCYCQAVAE